MTTAALEARESLLVIENTQICNDRKLDLHAEAYMETTLKAVLKPSHRQFRYFAGDFLTPIYRAVETVQRGNGSTYTA
jgi:hypothetical protein